MVIKKFGLKETNVNIKLHQLGAPIGSELDYLIINDIVHVCYVSDGSKAQAQRNKTRSGKGGALIPRTEAIDDLRSFIDYDENGKILGVELLFIGGTWSSLPKLRECLKDTTWYIWVSLAISGWAELDRRSKLLASAPIKSIAQSKAK